MALSPWFGHAMPPPSPACGSKPIDESLQWLAHPVRGAARELFRSWERARAVEAGREVRNVAGMVVKVRPR